MRKQTIANLKTMNMEREIKFRGKRTKAGDPLERWIEGSLCRYTNIYDETVTRIMSPSGHMNDVRPETVGQFTGLKDKNGTEIYEDDIVALCYGLPGLEVFAWVRYKDGAFILTEGERDYGFLPSRINLEMTVAGNIHDNKELIDKIKQVCNEKRTD